MDPKIRTDEVFTVVDTGAHQILAEVTGEYVSFVSIHDDGRAWGEDISYETAERLRDWLTEYLEANR